MPAGAFRTPAALTRLNEPRASGQAKIDTLILKAWSWASKIQMLQKPTPETKAVAEGTT